MKFASISLKLGDREVRLHPSRLEFLDAIRKTGSISKACVQQGISYRTGLNWLKEIEHVTGRCPTESQRGGKGGGATALTEHGNKILETYYLTQSARRPGFVTTFVEMRLSAHNLLRGKVSEIKEGDVLSMVVVELETPQQVKSVITTDSLRRLNIKPGDMLLVILKATEVMLMKP